MTTRSQFPPVPSAEELRVVQEGLAREAVRQVRLPIDPTVLSENDARALAAWLQDQALRLQAHAAVEAARRTWPEQLRAVRFEISDFPSREERHLLNIAIVDPMPGIARGTAAEISTRWERALGPYWDFTSAATRALFVRLFPLGQVIAGPDQLPSVATLVLTPVDRALARAGALTRDLPAADHDAPARPRL